MSWGHKMKSVKSLLLGAAAGLFAVAGAQAADLPVKAKPVQYVKICSLYGAGFYYIPGTDMCIKVGGYVRTQAEWGSVNGVSPGTVGPSGFATSATAAPFGTITNGLYDRSSNNFNMTGRGVLTVDARNQSEYGTVRGYIRLGGQSISNGVATPTFFVERAFIQFAGFTAGRTQSFFDIFTTTERFNYNEFEDLRRHLQLWRRPDWLHCPVRERHVGLGFCRVSSLSPHSRCARRKCRCVRF